MWVIRGEQASIEYFRATGTAECIIIYRICLYWASTVVYVGVACIIFHLSCPVLIHWGITYALHIFLMLSCHIKFWIPAGFSGRSHYWLYFRPGLQSLKIQRAWSWDDCFCLFCHLSWDNPHQRPQNKEDKSHYKTNQSNYLKNIPVSKAEYWNIGRSTFSSLQHREVKYMWVTKQPTIPNP